MKIFSTEFFSAVSWTLVHSLWQGLIIALLAGITILATKKSTSAKRYNLLTVLLFLFIAGVIVTFFTELKFQSKEIPRLGDKVVLYQKIIIDQSSQERIRTDEMNPAAMWHNISSYVDAHSQWIVLCWFLFFMVNFIRLGTGLVYIHRLRYRQNYPVAEEWINRLKELSTLSAVRVPVLFLESELVKVPVVIGMFKPVILVPVGLLMNLPPSQVEAILLHELSHIRRKDYLVNLIQTFATTIFFFNPAILWISSLMREEREACCDDMVVGLTTDKTTYLEALVSFQEYTMERNTQALALGGHKNFLLKRVSRMLTQENKKLNIMEKTVLLTGVAALMAFSFIQQPTEKLMVSVPVKVEAKVHPAAPAKPVLKETQQVLPVAGKMSTTRLIPAKKVIPVIVVDTVPKKVEPVQDNERNFPNISTRTNDDGTTKTTRIEATDQSGKKYRINKINDKVTEMYVNDVAVPENEINNYQSVIDQIDRQRESNALLARKRMEERRQQSLMEREKRMVERNARMNEDRQRRQKELTEKRVAMDKDRSQRTIERANKEREIRRTTVAVGSSNREIGSIINDLSNAKVIDDRDNLSFSLNNESLVVNGKKQPSELHKQLKEKYIRKSGDLYKYSKSGNSTTITINRD